jgi:hypothetical protein
MLDGCTVEHRECESLGVLFSEYLLNFSYMKIEAAKNVAE